MNDIRGAIIEPKTIEQIPGYFLFMHNGGGILRFLAEYQDMDPELLIKAIIRSEDQLQYHVLYVAEDQKPSEIRSVFYHDLQKAFTGRIPWVKIYVAPYIGNPLQGLELFAQMDAKGQIKIPKDKIIWQQIGDLEPGDDLDETRFAFHALRLILGGVRVQQQIPVKEIDEQREMAYRRDKMEGLTGTDLAAAKEIGHYREWSESNDDEEGWDC